jgi:hypothetical protein
MQPGDVMILPESTTHLVYPWAPLDRPRQVLGLRYQMQVRAMTVSLAVQHHRTASMRFTEACSLCSMVQHLGAKKLLAMKSLSRTPVYFLYKITKEIYRAVHG